MNVLSAFSAAWPTVCQAAARVGLQVLLTSSALLVMGLAGVWALRRNSPVYTLLVCQAALGGTVLCLLAALLWGGQAGGLLRVPMPSAQTLDGSAGTQASPENQRSPSGAMPLLAEGKRASAGGRALQDKRVSAAFVQVQTAAATPSSAPQANSALFPFAGFLQASSPTTHLNGFGKMYVGLAVVWLGGALILLIWLGLCYAGIYRLRRRTTPVEDAEVQQRLRAVCAAQNTSVPVLLVSADVQSVFLVGVWRPAILLPATYASDFDPETLQAVLTHEAAHLRAQEGWWTLLARILCALCWMQPLLWRLCRIREQAAEEVCDQAVLAWGIAPRAYAECLVSLAERLSPARWERAAGSGSVVFRSSLAQRVQKVLHTSCITPARLSLGGRLAVAIGSAFLACALSLAVSANPAQADGSLDDPRLSQKVLISAEGVPIGDLLALVAQKTGIQIKADGFTVDDKIIVYGPPRPLKAIMEDIAILFNDAWLHSQQNGRHTYRLTRNPRERDYEETLAGEMNRRLLAQMDEQIRALEETPEQLAKRPASDPVRKSLSDRESRVATSIFALLTPSQRLQLLERWQVYLPVSALTTAQKDGIEDLFHGSRFDELNRLPEVLNGTMAPVTQIQRADMDQREITFNVLKASGVNRQSTSMSIFLTAPTGMNMPTMDIRTDARFVLSPHGNPYTGKAVQSGALPDAQAISAAVGGAWPDRLKALWEKTGQPIVADYYRSKPVLVAAEEDAPADETPDLQALDGLCRPEGYLWWNRGKTLLLRKRDWYMQQLYEVPDRWVLAQSQRLNAHRGELTCGDVLRLEELTTNQIAGLNESLGKPADRLQLAGLRELLAVVAASPGDKNAAIPKGVIGRDIMPRQLAIMPNLEDLHQQRLLHDFLFAFHRKIAPKDVTPGDFGFIIFPSWRDPKNAADPGSVSADIMLYTGKQGMGAGYQIALPLALPEDRSGRSHVELTP